MTELLDRTTTTGAAQRPGTETAVREPSARPRLPRRLVAAFADRMDLRRRDVAWFLPTFVAGMVLNLVGMFRFPQFVDDEGTYTAQAYAVERLGELTHYTYWYDHPPLGWLQMAGWTGLTGAFDRYPFAVMAGREFMMVTLAASAVLLWTLVRRLRFPRPVAAASLLLFLATPLAVQFHRTVYLDNIATVWILAAFVLATIRSRQLAGFMLAAFAAAVAVLTKETYLLLTPFVAWMMVRNALPAIRRYTLAASGAVFVLTGVAYLVFALVKGELMPGPDRTSLWDAIMFQLVSREASGSLTDPTSLIRESVDVWIDLSPAFLVAGGVAMLLGLASRTLRPLAAALVLLVVMIVRPGGYVPVPHIVAMLPLMAVLVPGVAWLVWSRVRSRVPAGRVGRVAVAVAVVAAVAIGTVPQTAAQWRGQVLSDANVPFRSAQAWIEANVPRDHRLIVDDAMWVDLVESGFDRDNVVWYYKVDTDPAVIAQSPNGWRDADWVVTTDSMLTIPGQFPRVTDAIENSVVVAAFGEGDERVEIRRVQPQGAEVAEETAVTELAARTAFGSQLAENPNLTLEQGAQAVADGALDPRALLLLADLAARGQVGVTDLPELRGEEGMLRRTVVLGALDGQPIDAAAAAALQVRIDRMPEAWAPVTASLVGDELTLTWAVGPPVGLLPAPVS